jgi:hypothetical protein
MAPAQLAFFWRMNAHAEISGEVAELFADVLQLRFAGNAGLALVRPDGYIAYTSHKSDTAAFEGVRSVLQRQTLPQPTAEEAAC